MSIYLKGEDSYSLLSVKLGDILEPVICDMTYTFITQENDEAYYSFAKRNIEAMGYEVVEVLITQDKLEELEKHLDRYKEKMELALYRLKETFDGVLHPEEVESMLVNPVMGGAYLIIEDNKIVIEDDIDKKRKAIEAYKEELYQKQLEEEYEEDYDDYDEDYEEDCDELCHDCYSEYDDCDCETSCSSAFIDIEAVFDDSDDEDCCSGCSNCYM